MADSTGRYTATYDAVGETMVTASPNSQRQTFSYDAIGLRRSMDATGAGRFTYSYDVAGQITSLLNPYSERTTFSYDDGGRRTVQRNANGTRVSMAYDAASQTTQVFHRTSAAVSLLQLDYKYDPAGNRSGVAENVSAARTTWSYDKQNQLLGEYRTGTNAYRQTFTYDAGSNRTLKNVDAARTTYAYDAANQLKYGQAVAGRTTYTYDLTGNQKIEQPPAGNRTTTTWNYENQPTQYRLSSGGMPVTMTYNGDNRRVTSQQGAATTKFVWDRPIDAYLTELNASNAVQAVYTNEPQQYGSVVSQRRSSTSHTLHADALGTTRLLTTSAQASSDTYLYDAWGNQVAITGSTVNPFRWVGRFGYYQDASTGLVYVRARMYVATTARWASLDPIGLSGGINLFAYADNDAILKSDPSGMDLIPPGIPNLPKKALEKICLAWVAVEKRKSQDWLLDIPGCPCHVDCLDPDEWTTPNPEPTHPGAEVCTRSKNKSLLCKPGQQCCYSAGQLITGGPGAGTPDKISPEPKICAGLHFAEDVYFFFVCKGAGRLDLYLEMRPPNNRVGCEPWMS